MSRIRIQSLLIALVICSHFAWADGYKIKVKIAGLSDTSLILGHHYGKSMYADDTIRLNVKGEGVFAGNTALPQGMYIIFLPSKDYFDVLIGADQSFSIATDTIDLVGRMLVTDCPESEAFATYQKFMVDRSKEAKTIKEKRDKAATDADKKALASEMDDLNARVKAHLASEVEKYKGTFYSKFLLATKEVEVPNPPHDAQGNITDSAFQYNYFVRHYFDHFDLADIRMLRTPLYEQQVMYYLDKVVVQIPDSLIKSCDYLIETVRADTNLFRYMLITVFNKYVQSNIMGFDAIFVHLAEKYYIPEATWSDRKFIEDLKDRVLKTKPTLIGNKAPEIQMLVVPAEHFLEAATDTAAKNNPHAGYSMNLSQVRADYTVLVFWEADCGHCKKAIPKLHTEYKEIKALGGEIVAVNMLSGVDGKQKWVDFVNQHELYDWMNVWNPYDYKHKVLYDVSSTPRVFVLDKNKVIVAKNIGVEQALEVIRFYSKK